MVEPTGRCEHLINVRKGRIGKCDNYLDRHRTLQWRQRAAPGKIKTQGAVKLHLLSDPDAYLPGFAPIPDGKKADVNIARIVSSAPGSIVVMDRGYYDAARSARWTRTGVS